MRFLSPALTPARHFGNYPRAPIGTNEALALQASSKRWRPTAADIELIVEHSAARMPAAAIAKALGIEVEDLHELSRRLVTGRALLPDRPSPPPDGEDLRPPIYSGFPVVNK